jgi:rod shape determining protein RodA
MLFASGLPMKLFTSLCLLGGASLVPLWRWFLKDYHKLRILVLFDPEVSARIAYNGIQSMIAVGGGGLFGYGFLKGPQTQYSVLPAKHTDFIFASIAEEEGFIGAMLVIALLSVLVWRVFWSASQVHDRFSFMMCVGIGGMLMSQILINVGMCLGVMPVIGITLPLISYGGTSVVTTFAALGLVCGVKMRQRPERLL